MNAKQTVERMAKELTNAGYKLHTTEVADDKLMFAFVTPENSNIFTKSEMFYISASYSKYTNRWSAFFSYSSHGLFIDSVHKSKMSYRDMWDQINSSIKYEIAFLPKVGA